MLGQPWWEELFTQPLVDLGSNGDRGLSGVMSPRDEVGAERRGVNATFLENAEDYYTNTKDLTTGEA